MTEISGPLDIDRPPSNRWVEVWRQFRAHKGAMAGAVVFGLIIAGVFLGPFVYPHDPQYLPSGRYFITLRDTRPIYVALWDPSAKVNWHYVLGTDNLGRDNLARFLSGGAGVNFRGLDRDDLVDCSWHFRWADCGFLPAF